MEAVALGRVRLSLRATLSFGLVRIAAGFTAGVLLHRLWVLRGTPLYLYDFGLKLTGDMDAAEDWGPELQERFIEAFDATYRGLAEPGKFNRLVMTGGLTWEEIAWLRAISRYLVQAGSPYSQPYVASALNDNPEIAAALGIPLNTGYTRLRLARSDFAAAVARLRRRGPS